jgi:A/G-specific adenine glycosylase
VVRHVQVEAAPRDVEIARSCAPLLERWFQLGGRRFVWRSWSDEYRVLVAEVLLQRTRAEAAEAFLPSFLSAYPNWGALASSDRDELEELLRPLGLARRRAESLRSLAGILVEAPDQRDYEYLPGIGQYIGRAARVAMYGSREAMVDANFVRVLRRVFDGPWMADYRYDQRLQCLARSLTEGAHDPRVVNWAVLDLGALLCTPRRPRCGRCPLQSRCRAGQALWTEQ